MLSRFLSLLLLLLLSLLLLLNADVLASWTDDNFELVILHTNDMHDRFEQADVYGNTCTDLLSKSGKCYGGIARLKTAVERFKHEASERNVSSVFLNAGDTFQGTPYYTTFKWKMAANLIPKLGIDVMCIGNHEFNAGVRDLASYLKSISAPIVLANADISGEPSLKNIVNLTPSTVLEFGNVKVGIIGYTVPLKKTPTRNVTFIDEIIAIREEAKLLKSQNVSVIIALGHSGFDTDIEVAKNVPEISLVVGGHSHTFLYTPKNETPSVDEVTAEYPYIVTQDSGRKVPVVQAYCNTKYLGVLNAKFDKNGEVISAVGNPVLLDKNFEEDRTLLKDVLVYKGTIEKFLKDLNGKTNVLLTSRLTLENPESNFGNLITDAFVHYAAEQYEGKSGWTDAAIGILQAGTVRANIDRREDNGVMTYADIMTSLPINDNLVKMNTSGQTLLNALEYSIKKVHHTNSNLFINNYLHVSGLKVTLDLNREAGNRVQSVLVRCAKCVIPTYEKLQNSRVYTIVTTDFLSRGGDGFKMFATENSGFQSLAISCRQVVSEYLKAHHPVYPGYDGRVIITHAEINLNSPATKNRFYFVTIAMNLFICITFYRFN